MASYGFVFHAFIDEVHVYVHLFLRLVPRGTFRIIALFGVCVKGCWCGPMNNHSL